MGALVGKCLARQPTARPSVNELLALPLVVREIYNGTSGDLAALNAFNSLGLVITIGVLLRLGHIARAGRALLLAQFVGSLVLVLAGWVVQQYLFVFFVFMWGICGGVAMPMSRTLMQQTAPPALRAAGATGGGGGGGGGGEGGGGRRGGGEEGGGEGGKEGGGGGGGVVAVGAVGLQVEAGDPRVLGERKAPGGARKHDESDAISPSLRVLKKPGEFGL